MLVGGGMSNVKSIKPSFRFSFLLLLLTKSLKISFTKSFFLPANQQSRNRNMDVKHGNGLGK